MQNFACLGSVWLWFYEVKVSACESLREGIAAIFGPENGEANEIIQSLALTLEIPQFQTFWNPNFGTFSELGKADKKEVFNFNLYPSPSVLSKAFATLIRENDWKSYTVIYENDDGLVRLQEVLKSLNPNVRYRKLGPGPDHRFFIN